MLTSITTETALRWPIPNDQTVGLVGNEDALATHFCEMHGATLRAKATTRYNCHGLTFGSRRTCIDDETSIARILSDDGYRLVAQADVMPGDIVLYYDFDGTVSHSGIVVEAPSPQIPFTRIVSKWGVPGAEYLHWVHRSPYGSDYKYYRVDHSSGTPLLAKIILTS